MTRDEAAAVLERHGYQYQGTRHLPDAARDEVKAALLVLHTEPPVQPRPKAPGIPDAEWDKVVADDAFRTARSRKVAVEAAVTVTVRVGR